MSFVVYNKNTGKYLNNHSGSYNSYKRNVMYKHYGYGNGGFRWGTDEHKEYSRQCNLHTETTCYQSEACDSRVYRSRGGAVNSVGSYRTGLPDHLVVREITIKTTIVE